jgi:hypothetical protein
MRATPYLTAHIFIIFNTHLKEGSFKTKILFHNERKSGFKNTINVIHVM